MAKQKIKKGDLVQVITGKDKGLQGKVIQSFPKDGKVIVEGVNRVKKHTKVGQTARGSQTGGIITTEAPIHVSNVQVVCPRCDKPTRVGHTQLEGGRHVRVCKHCGEQIEGAGK